ncbi:MAG: cytochrome c [Vicinamibacterales bacterium]
MKSNVAMVLATAGFLAVLSVAVGRAQGATTSTWDGVYTEAQATHGADVYAENCASCHAGNLMGDGFAPALTGGPFANNWNGLTVGDLFERIRTTMPPDGPDKVSREDKAAIIAYILKVAGFPAGERPLADRTAYLKQISYDAFKPGH